MTQKVAGDNWQYRIESYHQNPGEASWSRVPEDQAEIWFGFRAKGEDHRCFGVFPSRADAEKAMAILKERDKQPDAERPEAARFRKILEGKVEKQQEPEKARDNSREM